MVSLPRKCISILALGRRDAYPTRKNQDLRDRDLETGLLHRSVVIKRRFFAETRFLCLDAENDSCGMGILPV
ncbi:hypothetical protein [Microseira sp. BLCC-F43]|uniref:hypothetical protein n=1 Tax=Microseira sp. BLCC-F43 TaxID=3153602 RepID=UPI0035B9D809